MTTDSCIHGAIFLSCGGSGITYGYEVESGTIILSDYSL
jgi:hypothetical protein